MPREHEQDTITVLNIDTDCDFVEESGLSHRDFFEVKWDGIPHRVKAGETRRFPRYLAEHFAKHLADHILTKKGDELGRPHMINSKIERPKVIEQIIIDTEYFLPQDVKTVGEQVVEDVERLNAVDVGPVENKALGKLQDEPAGLDEIMKNVKEETEEDTTGKETSIFDENKPLPTKKELVEACFNQGIEITGKENKDQLISKLKNF